MPYMIHLLFFSLVASSPLPSAQSVTPVPVLASTQQQALSIASQTDFGELQRAGKLSSAAYAGCDGAVEDVTITHQINDNRTDTQGYIGYSTTRQRITVVFRGSNSFKDYISDLDVNLVPLTDLKGCSVPSDVKIMNGIHRSWKAVHDDILSNVRTLIQRYPSYSLETTGHSLGGSLTYLSFIALSQNFPDKQIMSHPLAAFPIGNEAFASFATGLTGKNRMVCRGTNRGDGVPNMYSMPPVVFQHFGTEFYTNGTQTTTTRCVGERDTRCSAGNGAIGPNIHHYSIFGVSMAGQGAYECVKSGGTFGANGGSITKM